MKNFEELDIWKQGCQLAVDIYQVTEKGPFSKDFGLRDQIRRSAVSIPSNISEGKERETVRELIRYLYIAKGSAAELRTQLYIAHSIGFLDVYQHNSLSERVTTLSKQIGSFIRKLKGGRATEPADYSE
jgi:four helix bundle protein